MHAVQKNDPNIERSLIVPYIIQSYSAKSESSSKIEQNVGIATLELQIKSNMNKGRTSLKPKDLLLFERAKNNINITVDTIERIPLTARHILEKRFSLISRVKLLNTEQILYSLNRRQIFQVCLKYYFCLFGKTKRNH